eukprot:26480-Alexandrium_andersonii.AAC.1
MSASLVGSEMCIRDRRITARAPRAETGCRLCAAECPAEKERKEEEAAVSYTHLTLPTICSV